jgi:prepilin-type N-terminal cleavage/methylation domain-containing protein
MKTHSPLKRSSGFTLIEILLAIGILALGITSVLSMFMMGARSHRRATDRARSALLADTVINQIRTDLAQSLPKCYYEDASHNLSFVDPADTNTPPTPIRPENRNPATHADFPEFRYYVAFDKLYDSGRDYYKVRVIIVWDTAGLNAAGTLDPRNSETFETIVRRKNY